MNTLEVLYWARTLSAPLFALGVVLTVAGVSGIVRARRRGAR